MLCSLWTNLLALSIFSPVITALPKFCWSTSYPQKPSCFFIHYLQLSGQHLNLWVTNNRVGVCHQLCSNEGRTRKMCRITGAVSHIPSLKPKCSLRYQIGVLCGCWQLDGTKFTDHHEPRSALGLLQCKLEPSVASCVSRIPGGAAAPLEHQHPGCAEGLNSFHCLKLRR